MRLEPEKSRFANMVYIGAALIVLAAIGIGVASTVFHRAYVTATPYRFTAQVDTTLDSSPQSSSLPYHKVEVSDTVTKSVPATGSQHVENHASGVITVFNSYSTTQQRLITNTRFATADGKIYRIHEPIVVPGYSTKAGVKVPGSIDVTAYADQAGDTYNTDLTNFTIPGLKGSKQYTLIFAHSKTPMTGGFIGEQAVVDAALRTQTIDGLKADLNRSLQSKIHAAVVAGSVIFDDSIHITYTENSDTVQGGNAVLSVSGTAAAPAFVEDALAHELATDTTSTYSGPLALENPTELSVNVDSPIAVTQEQSISVSISGSAKLVSTYNSAQLAKDLAGKSKNDIQSVLPQYPGLSNLEVKIYPFWLSGLPSDPAKVIIQSTPSPKAQ